MAKALPVALAIVAVWSARAAALPKAVLVTGAGSSCPAAAAVAQELQRTWPHLPIRVETGPPSSARVEIEDLGLSYRVLVQGAGRRFNDPQRKCRERTRAAAVFAALVLDPPALPALPPEALPTLSVPSPPQPSRLPPAPVPPRLRVDLEGSGLLLVAPQTDSGTLIGGGAGLRLALGGRYLGGALGIAGLAPVSLDLAGGRARLQRVPIDLTLRGSYRRGRSEVLAAAGVALAVLLIDGLDRSDAASSARLDPEFLLGVGYRYWARDRLALLGSLHLSISARPYELALLPQGVVGTTPQAWIDLSLGLATRLR